jgi:alcohol dehydrogenase class IV
MEAGDAPADAPSGGVADRRLMPRALVYDPALVATTPVGIRCASAMNGFNKAVEALYSPNATPVTDGTATRGLALMRRGFAALPDENPDPERLSDAVAGVVLAQYGISTPRAYKLGVIHAFGHGLRDYDVHQGVAHAVVTPHVLRALFDAVDGRRRLLADGLDIDASGMTDEEVSEAVVDAVASVRDDLDLPARIRDLDAVERGDLGEVAHVIADDSLLDATPAGFDPTVEEIESVLGAAW